jgi:hypothetical protein
MRPQSWLRGGGDGKSALLTEMRGFCVVLMLAAVPDAAHGDVFEEDFFGAQLLRNRNQTKAERARWNEEGIRINQCRNS